MKTCANLRGLRSAVPGRPVTIRDHRTGYRYPALLYRGAARGMYLEANYAPRPGSTVLILGSCRARGPSGTMRALIRWRLPLRALDSAWSYGLGIELTT